MARLPHARAARSADLGALAPQPRATPWPEGAASTWLSRVLPLAFVGLVGAVAAWRLQYGIDFTDESFYVVVPLRLLHGAKPYVDETAVTQQTAAFLTVPFLWLYRLVAGTTAIVLAVRAAALALALVVALAVRQALRPVAGNVAATVAAGALVAFAPFDIRSLGYDTYGALLFATGCFLTTCARTRRANAAAGVAHGLAVFAYPPLALVVFALALARAKRVAYWLPAVAIPVAGGAALVRSAGLETILRDFRDSEHDLGQGGGIAKLRSIAHHEVQTFHSWPRLLALVAMLVVLWYVKRSLVVPVLAVLPVAAVSRGFSDPAGSLEWVTAFGAVALPLALLLRDEVTRRLMAWVWLPSLAAGIVTAYSSANGGVNLGMGFLAGAVVTCVLLVRAAERAAGTVPAAFVACAPVAVLAVLLVVPVYRDGAVSTLTARVSQGSYAGLLTSPRKAAFLTSLQRRLAPLTPSCRVFFFDDFPGGYLLSHATPETNGAWTAQISPARTSAYAGAVVTYLRRRGLPDVMVMMHRIPYAPPGSARIEGYQPDDPLVRLARGRAYRPAAKTFDYTIYDLRASGCRTR